MEIDGKTYDMLDTSFPTIDPEHPYDLTPEEQEVMNRLRTSFIHCEKAAAPCTASAKTRQHV